MNNNKNIKIHISGIVQGVGFRPFIFNLAERFGLKGWVRNTSNGVDIEISGRLAETDSFIISIKKELPSLARIDALDVSYGAYKKFDSFSIITSEVVENAFQPISPDVSTCPDCLKELFDPLNRRFRYPFINCTNCGPRFTIIKDIPYDRPNTTMETFRMCPDCAREYTNPRDRRFHAQPVACSVCGPMIWLEESSKTDFQALARGDEAIVSARKLLAEGKILAIKGLGGFHLACDATNPAAVVELRKRKLRVDKPFAVMMPNIQTVRQFCHINSDEQILLESRQHPIVLLNAKPNQDFCSEVAPNQKTLGVMLPYTPLHYLLMEPGEDISPVLVMTSGNLSEEPIATDNAEAHEHLGSLADYFLMHDRDIRTRCDDSVVRVVNTCHIAGNSKQTQPNSYGMYFLRRSRGYAPDSIVLPGSSPSILATGSDLKNTFCLTRENYAFLSHHIGDMENYETLNSFEDGITHFQKLFKITPELIVYDLHPNYLASRYAIQRAERENIPAIGVQHHHSHIAACMADNGLDGSHPVLGLALDGTGFGTDDAIWGGEFLLADYQKFERMYHLKYFPLPGGDAAIKKPGRTALAMLWSLGIQWEDFLPPCREFSSIELKALETQLSRNINTVPTSSMGRLFDAAASLAGIRQTVNYEAQAAIEFEALMDPDENRAYPFEIHERTVDYEPMVQSLLNDIRQDISHSKISARFHNGIAACAGKVCSLMRKESGIDVVMLSGGVWQNIALLEKTIRVLQKDGFSVYIHHQVPTNDGGISLGQAVIGANSIH